MKLTRKQIKEGLDQMPIDTLLLGTPKTLTAKQKRFAEEVAKGSTKAEAYRKAYDTDTKPKYQSHEGQMLMQNPIIANYVEAIKLSIEAEKYLLPTHLRRLTIQRLTEKALDPNVNDAQQIKALELLGKITEVSLFTERKELTQQTDSKDAKTKLIEVLSQAIKSSKALNEDRRKSAEELLAEISGGSASNPNPSIIDQEDGYLSENEAEEEIATDETPPSATQPNLINGMADTMHTIPHSQSTLLDADSLLSDLETPPLSNSNSEGEGVSILHNTDDDMTIRDTPPYRNWVPYSPR
jgi:phage terminase small subunit